MSGAPRSACSASMDTWWHAPPRFTGGDDDQPTGTGKAAIRIDWPRLLRIPLHPRIVQPLPCYDKARSLIVKKERLPTRFDC